MVHFFGAFEKGAPAWKMAWSLKKVCGYAHHFQGHEKRYPGTFLRITRGQVNKVYMHITQS